MDIFVERESKKHRDAKNAVCQMYNALGNGYKALVEVPLIKYPAEPYEPWEKNWEHMAYMKQSDVPTFHQCKTRYNVSHGPFKVVDVAVFQFGRLKYSIEILNTNPVRPDQIQRIKKEGLVLYEVGADDVLAMEVGDRLDKIWKRLC